MRRTKAGGCISFLIFARCYDIDDVQREVQLVLARRSFRASKSYARVGMCYMMSKSKFGLRSWSQRQKLDTPKI